MKQYQEMLDPTPMTIAAGPTSGAYRSTLRDKRSTGFPTPRHNYILSHH